MENAAETLPLVAETPSAVDRLKYLLRRSRKTQAEFSRLLGIDPSSLSKVLTGRLPLTDSFANRVVVNLGVSKPWLLHGTDVPFPRRPETAPVCHDMAVEISDPYGRPKGAPVYDVDATAGHMPICNMFTTENVIGYLDMPGIDPCHPVIRVNGNSMTPQVPDGAYIQIREISDPSVIFWGQMYLVELEDYRMVKILRRNPDDPGSVILHSYNPDYDDVEVPRNSILKLFIVEHIFTSRTIA